ncbi:hypothetical protein LXL04_016154 [Taraxacum kok-saghyz]
MIARNDSERTPTATRAERHKEDGFEYATPQPPPLRRNRPARSTRSVWSLRSNQSITSSAIIEDLAEQVRARDATIAQMQQALQAAGLLPNPDEPASNKRESGDESRSIPRETPEVKSKSVRIGSTFKTFMECKPPTFLGVRTR